MPLARLRLLLLASILTFALAAPAQADEPAQHEQAERDKVLVLDLKVDGEIESALTTSLTTLLAGRMSRAPGLVVVTSEDLRQLVSFEEMKVALACDDASCLTDIGNALGTRRVLTGNITRVGETYVVAYTLLDLDEVRPLARETLRGSAEDLLAGIDALAARFGQVARTGEALERVLVETQAETQVEKTASPRIVGALMARRLPADWITLEDETIVTGNEHGVSTRKVMVAYQGPHRKPLPDNELYRAVGREDLAAQYEQTSGLLWGSFLTGLGVAVVGTAAIVGGTFWLLQSPYATDTPLAMGVLLGGPAVVGIASGILIGLPMLVDPNPLPPHERRRLVDEHNQKLLSLNPLLAPGLGLSHEVE